MVACPAAAVLVAAMLVVLAPIPANAGPSAPAKGDAPSTADLLTRIQALGRDLQHWLRIAHDTSMAGASVEPLEPEVEELERRFEELRRDLALTEPDETVESKARMIEMLLWNLRHALELGDARGALPRSAAQPVPSQMGAVLLDAGPPPNDDCADAIPITSGTVTGSTAEATNDGSASCGASVLSPDVWYRFVPPVNGIVFLTTSGSSFDTVLSVYSACGGHEYACNDDSFGLQSEIKLPAQAGSEYLIRVSGFDGAAGDFVLSLGGGAEITGTITDSTTSSPIPGNGRASVYDSFGYFIATGSADPTGFYAIGGLGTGQYYLVGGVECSGGCSHVPELYDDVWWPTEPLSGYQATEGTPVSATVGQTTPGIDFALDPASAISGEVRDLESAEPVEGSIVRLYDAAGNALWHTYTNSEGAYVLDTLASGTYQVAAAHPWYRAELFDGIPCESIPPSGCGATAGTPIEVPLGTTVPDIDFDLQVLATITGTVTDGGSGLPIEDATVYIRRPDGEIVSTDYTGSNGGFRIGGLADGSYLATAYHSDYYGELYDDIRLRAGQNYGLGTLISATAGLVTTGIDFGLTQRPRIAGRVTQTGTEAPIEHVALRIYDATGRDVGSSYTDASGFYETSPLEAGTYFVVTDSPGCMDELYEDIACEYGCNVAAGSPVIASEGVTTSDIDFVLDCLATVSGTVTAADSGAPLPSVPVELWQTGSAIRFGYTDASGAFSIDSVEPGNCFIATHGDGQYIDELYDNVGCFQGPPGGCDPFSGTPVVVSLNGNVTGVDFALDRGGVIAGTVNDAASGLPLEYAYVKVFDASGETVGYGTTTDAGTYEIDGLATGTYYVVATKNTSHLGVLYDGLSCAVSCNPTSGLPVSVTKGAATNEIDFALPPRGSITGHVSANQDGRPLSGIDMTLYLPDRSSAGHVHTDDEGAYVLERLLPGRYFLVASGLEVVDELYEDISCEGSCSVTQGTAIEVTDGTVPVVIDFALDLKGEIRGSVIAAQTGLPLPDTWIHLYDRTGELLGTEISGDDGLFRFVGIDPGTYYAWAFSADATPQLFEGIPCPWLSCDVTSGTPITVDLGQTVTGVHFELEGQGSIEGTFRDSVTGAPLAGLSARVWTADGDETRPLGVYSDANGHYTTGELPSGVYFVVSSGGTQGYLDELYDDIPCPPYPPIGCDPTKGAPVIVAPGITTTGIDFDLDYLDEGIAGVVTDGRSGGPLGGVRVDVWDAATLDLITSTLTYPNGAYLAAVPMASDYLVSTDSHSGYVDEVYDDVPCPAGSALEGLCDPASGSHVTVEPDGVTSGVDFSLERSRDDVLFEDGFESGNLDAWSKAQGAD
jgi:protocatechuate 3,4-dioxygenase beta subunit